VNSAHPLPPLLQAQSLSCKRGDRRLFSGLELTLHSGQVIWLRGDNGRGKTSLLRLLAGLVEPEQGQVFWSGLPAQSKAAHEQGAAPLYVAHANALKEDLTVHEAVSFLAGLPACTPRVDAHTVNAALDRLGMGRFAQARVRTLSQGQRRRAALARLALPGTPRVWLLDEPYDALDPLACEALDALACEHVAQGGAVVLTSHQPLSDKAPVHQTVWLTAQPTSVAKGLVA
jgi:heme exporter protein A